VLTYLANKDSRPLLPLLLPLLKSAVGTLTITLRIFPAVLGTIATILAIGYLNLYPVLVIDTMWGTEDAYAKMLQCGRWEDAPEHVLKAAPSQGLAARECTLMTAFHEFHFWQFQLQLSTGGPVRKVPVECTWGVRWGKVAGTATEAILVGIATWTGLWLLRRRLQLVVARQKSGEGDATACLNSGEAPQIEKA
jgi:hypothetical protein